MNISEIGSNKNISKLITSQFKDETIVIFGRSSVGKSTFINQIINFQMLEVGTGGITKAPIVLTNRYNFQLKENYQIINFYKMDFKVIIDTPGIDTKFNYDFLINYSDLIIFISDCQQGVTREDLIFLKRLEKSKKKFIILLSKIDLELQFIIKEEKEVISDLLKLKRKIKSFIDVTSIKFFTRNEEINKKYFEDLNELY